MTDAELRRALRRIHPPDELGAERRAWMLVRAAFVEREPAPRRPQVVRPLLVLAGALALIAAVVNPPVLNAIRDAVGRTTEKKVVQYKQALFSLPAQGRLLVNTAHGPWIIKPGGARRLLGRYRDASWSPRGLFVAAVARHELVALQPNGTVRWSLARSGRLSSPRWSPETGGSTSIAYLRGTTLRIVAGDGTEDTLLDGAVAPTAPAWKPGASFVLSYVTAAGRLRVYDVGRQKTVWHSLRLPKVTELAWSDDGTRLLALTRRSLIVFGGRGQRIGRAYLPADAVAAAFEPGSHRIATLLRFPQQSAVQLRDGDAPAARPDRVQRRRPLRHAGVVAERPLAPRRLAERRRVHVRDARRAAANRGRHRAPARRVPDGAPGGLVLFRLAIAAVLVGLAGSNASAAVHWHRSRSIGLPYAGRLLHGVQLPAHGRSFETWDPARKRIPNRGWRRWGSDRLVEIVLRVVREYRHAHPRARPLLIGDLSRTHGGDFGPQFGALGHASHQNGLDVDVYYPRRDGYLRPPARPRQIDHELAQDLLERFLRAGATAIFVGPHTGLRGPRKIVVPLVHHDNHMHVRIARANRRSFTGTSVQGRSIRALELGFGSRGSRRVLVVGCIHGNECAGTAVVRRLEQLPPPDFDLWVVPALNPDGRAAGTRENARGVDLNRNFAGPRRLSEPETRFAARLVRRLTPSVTIWFHQHEDRVRGWRGSIPAARRYADAAHMRFAAVPWPDGTATRWQNRRFPGAASFVVELPAGSLSPGDVAAQVRAIQRLGQ